MPPATGSSPDGKRLQSSSINTDDLMKYASKVGEPKFKYNSGSHQGPQIGNQRGSVTRRAIATAAGSAGKQSLVLSHDQPQTPSMN